MAISMFSLFGLIALTTHQRLKEVGIRKVFGAKTGQLLLTLSKDFVRLILIAIGLATPIAIMAMNEWLGGFVYKTAISLDVFLIAGGLTIFIAMITMSFHVIRAARTNPSTMLKYE